jgi:hypothetical protein
MADDGSDKNSATDGNPGQMNLKAVLYQGTAPLDVPIESILHAMKVILTTGETEFIAKCKALPQSQQSVLMEAGLANVIKSFIEEHKLYTLSTEAMEIMTSPPHKRCWPREAIQGEPGSQK